MVVPTSRRRTVAARTIAALAAQEFTAGFEAIAVVNGPDDGTAAGLRALAVPFPLTVLEDARPGAAAARNLGAEHARGELLLFLDDDMIASPSLLHEHDRAHRDGADVVVGHVPLHADSPRNFLSEAVGRWAEERAERLRTAGRVGPHDVLTGQLSVSRTTFREIGGFDARFRGFGNEDVDLGARLGAAGFRVVFNPDAVSRQLYVVSPRAYLRQRHELGAADVRLARRHTELARSAERDALRRDRPLRVPVRWAALAGLRLRPDSPRAQRWFFHARRLEYLAGVRRAGGMPARNPVRVLCYHSISNRPDGPLAAYSVSPEEFRKQVAFLDRHFRFIDPHELLRLLDGTGGVPRDALLVTFDDCYRDLLATALPILAERDAPALAFAVTGLPGATNAWDAAAGGEPMQLLDADELRAVAEQGVEIGAHSRSHAKLTGLPDAELRSELTVAFGDPYLPLLAYPYGVRDERVKEAAAALGYRGAFTVDSGVLDPDRVDRLELPRIEITARDRGVRFRWRVLRPW